MTTVTISSGQTIDDTLSNADMFAAYTLGSGDSFLNAGVLTITSSYANPNITAVSIPTGMPGNATAIENDGIIRINAANALYAYGVHELSFGPQFTNGVAGQITVIAQNACGFSAYDPTRPVTNNGSIQVTGSNSAYGLDLNNPGWTVTSSGTISVHSGIGYDFDNSKFTAVAVNLDSGRFTNTGRISASADDSPQYAAGILFTSYSGSVSTIVNAGDINAPLAIGERRANSPSSQTCLLSNTGTIEGQIILGAGDDTLSNSGTITGDIYTYDGNDALTNSGTIAGKVYLGTGDDNYDGRNGAISGKIDGGSGTDTAIFSGSQSAYTITRNGIETVVSGPKGAVTLDYFEYVQFDNATISVSIPNQIVNVEPIIQYTDFSVAATETVTYNADGTAFPSAAIILTSTNAQSGPSVFNAGTINATSTINGDIVTAIGAFESTTYTGSVIRNDGTITVNGTSSSLAAGITAPGYLPSVQNDATGIIRAQAGLAVGVESWDSAQAITNAGLIEADGLNFAAGLDLSNSNWTITNSGTITAHSGNGTQTALNMTPLSLQRTGVVGVLLHGSGNTLTNTGTIKAYADQNNAAAIGITWSSGSPTRPETIINYGDINASQAIYEQIDSQSSSGAAITNYGTIEGDISLAGGKDIVTNAGTMTGTVHLGVSSISVYGETDDNLFLGATGTLNGSLYGGAGNDTIHIGWGNASIDGGAGNNTVIFAGRRSAYTITNNGDGSVTVAGPRGTDTLKNIQTIGFASPQNDFDGSGYSDIVWQNDSGQAAVWTMNGFNQTGGSPVGGNPGPSWHVVGTGDFFGDGTADILWHNDDGSTVVWNMDGLKQTDSAYVGANPGTSWHVKSSGDFNGDGKADILWQNNNGQAAIWEMNGYSVLSANTVGGNPGASWHVVGSGDFNRDGKADIVWQSDSGQAAIWTMDGLNQTGSYFVGGNPGPTWHVKGVGDFYGTGQADLLWQNDNGQAAIWTMNGITQVSSTFIGGNPGPAWHIVGTGDYNGDNKADILWQNDNGQAAVWTMSGITQLGGSLVGGNPGTSWHIPSGVG